MTSPSISYAEGRAVIARWLWRIERAGPDVFPETTREKYSADFNLLKDTALLLSVIDERKRAREARG